MAGPVLLSVGPRQQPNMNMMILTEFLFDNSKYLVLVVMRGGSCQNLHGLTSNVCGFIFAVRWVVPLYLETSSVLFASLVPSIVRLPLCFVNCRLPIPFGAFSFYFICLILCKLRPFRFPDLATGTAKRRLDC